MHEATAAAPARVPEVLGGWDRLRLALLAVQLLVLLVTAVVGHRETPLADLEEAVAQGRVDSVEIVGAAPSGDQGYGVQAVRWRDGPVRRTAEALVGARPAAGAVDLPWRDTDLGVLLSRSDSDLEVRRGEQAYPNSHGELLGWRVPTWTALAAVAALLLNVGFLICVPRTWRATRWAWCWLMTVPVAGSVLMLLLSGPTPGLPAPRSARRLTGGWALLGTAVISALSRPGTTGGG